MSSAFNITIDGHAIEVGPGQSVLDAARALGIEIPTLCYLEKCGPLNSCLVCLVKINGKLVPSCGTKVQQGMTVESETSEVHEARRTALELLFSDHVGDCLSPCNRLCPLRMNIPQMIRQIRGGKLDDATATVRDALPLAAVLGRLCHHPCEQGCRRGTWDDAAAIREMERFVADWDLGIRNVAAGSNVESRGGTPREPAGGDACATSLTAPADEPQTPPHPGHLLLGGGEGGNGRSSYLPRCKPASGKSVVIIGAGPTGLAAAYHLLREGHACTIADRHPAAGGSLRAVSQQTLPANVLDAELKHIERLGAKFHLGVSLGTDVTFDGLLRGFDAILVATGELSKAEGEALGLEMTPGGIKTHPETFQTNRPGVFAAGRAVRPMTQIIRAMSDGQSAAECIHQFVSGRAIRRSGKPFSSIMGRLDPGELKEFLRTAAPSASVSPCDACAGYTRKEAATEASRCLHCDCRSSGQCVLQHYAQVYGADASRFREQRRKFEQHEQPCGVIFEPGKCILCGICVKLTELAREPLGLTFIGRGFDVRIGAPLNHTIEDGLQKVAAECVEHCPTGALVFREEGQRTEPFPACAPAPGVEKSSP